MSSPKAILSIQSEVVTGHVGNAAARFALQRLGHEAWTVPTVLLSSHAAHAGFAGEATNPALLARLVDALDTQGRLALADGVLSGYLGSTEQAEIVADAVVRTRRQNKMALYCLDPVIGDDGRVYTRPGVAEAIAATLLPLADIVTPNAFELSLLANRQVTGPAGAADAALALNRPIVVVTSVPHGDRLGTLLVAEGSALLASTPRLANPPRGAGDLFAALLFGHLVAGRAVAEALERTLLSTYHVLSLSEGAPEMALIAEQEALAAPPALPGLRLEPVELRSGGHG